MKPSKLSIHALALFVATLMVVLSCEKPKIQPMTITLKMPSTTNTGQSSFNFPSDIMGSISIEATAGNYNSIRHLGYYDFNCPFGTYCPKLTEFPISVPSSGPFTLRVTAMTRTCSNVFLPSCKSEIGSDVGALLKYEWNVPISAGQVTNGGSFQLFGDAMGRSGQPTLTKKCCCANRIAGLKCGVQSNGTAFVSCVPASFETAYNYTGVCGADDAEGFSCPGAGDKIDDNTKNCGKPCGIGMPCTDNGYNCSSPNLTNNGICQLPCKFDSQCPNGLGCNNGWCR
jgi:hypothetical protein